MIFKKFLVFFLISLPIIAFPQKVIDLHRTYGDTLPDHFQLDIDQTCDLIHARTSEDLKSGPFKKDCYIFADLTALQIKNYFDHGYIYSDWASFEDYLNQIIQKILPKELQTDKSIHAYLYKSGYSFVSGTPLGSTIIGIGLFADVYDEATVAAFLAHELAHYYKQHYLTQFINPENKLKEWLPKINKSSQYSIENELEVDALAMTWMKNAGYDLNGMLQFYNIEKQYEKKSLLIKKAPNVFMSKRMHKPLSNERLKKIKAFITKNKAKKGALYLVSEAKFKAFSQQAKPEILRHLLNSSSGIHKCIEVAFKFHIYDPENSIYIYYLMEAIRRNAHLDNAFWAENFIINRYNKKPEIKHLFTKIPVEILGLRSDKIRDIVTKSYWKESLKFRTNEQAFEYFFTIGEDNQEAECFLSYALSVLDNTRIRNLRLRQYLAFKEIKHRDFATNLLNNTIFKNLKNQKLSILSGFDVIVKQGKHKIAINKMENKDQSNQIKNLLKKPLEGFRGRKMMFLSDIKNTQLNNYRTLKKLDYFWFALRECQEKQGALHILNPEFWEIMNHLGYSEIEFINCRYIETRKRRRKIKDYQAVRMLDFDSIVNPAKRSKSFQVNIKCFRMIEGGIMFVKSYSQEEILTFKHPANKQIIGRIKSKMEKSDIRVRELDGLYRERNK